VFSLSTKSLAGEHSYYNALVKEKPELAKGALIELKDSETEPFALSDRAGFKEYQAFTWLSNRTDEEWSL
jgi:hypothetical protein